MRIYTKSVFVAIFIINSFAVLSQEYIIVTPEKVTIDTRLTGIWEGSEENQQQQGVSRRWKMFRFDNGDYSIEFLTIIQRDTLKTIETGNWWVENGNFYERHDASGKVDAYSYEVLDERHVKFTAIKIGVEFESSTYEFIDTKSGDLENRNELESKVEELFELTKIEEEFNGLLEALGLEILDEETYDELSESFKSIKENYKQDLIDLYTSKLTINEIQSLIDLFNSDVGKLLLTKVEELQKGSLEMGMNYGEIISNMVLNKVDSINQVRLTSPTEGCTQFYNGEYKLSFKGIEYTIKRNENLQTAYYEGDPNEYLYRIDWTGDCTYKLTSLDDESEVIDGTIYAKEQNKYFFIEKHLTYDFYNQGIAELKISK